MRRARLKPVAIVPIRRKPTQGGINTEANESADTSDKTKEDDLKQININKPEEPPEENVKELLISAKRAVNNELNNKTESHNNNGSNEEPLAEEIHKNELSNKNELYSINDLHNNDKIHYIHEPSDKESSITENLNIQPDVGNKNLDTSHQSEIPGTVSNVLGSPTKIIQNRSCFMRPVPRLNNSSRIRRNSIQGSGASASESEDDGKKVINTTSNRTRNDSICSVQSNKEVNSNVETTENMKSDTQKLRKAEGRRRMVISESARKLAEARREFFIKHENKTPDRTKLTMYDLIYYNPVTNPMKRSKESTANRVERDSISQIDEIEEEEENEDDPSAMPVPQVKVGPDGQLIVDEQSLVIEQTSVKKGREILAKKAIIEDDNYGSGFYKRRPKSKEWPKWETLKFYKALNIVGTDFLLMQTLFPNRTREEIKLKYKKEEKMNRRLVEKALEYHQEFGPETQEELVKFEELSRQLSTQKNREQKHSKSKIKRKAKKKRAHRLTATSIGEMGASEDEDSIEPEETKADEESTETNNNQCQQRAKKRSKSNNKKSDDNASEDEPEPLDAEVISDSDTEIYKVRPTRSGRLPKVRKLQGPDVNNLHSTDNSREETSDASVAHEQVTANSNESTVNTAIYPEVIKSAIPDINQMEPGSVVILSKGSSEEPGETVLQVYMVSSNRNSLNNQIKCDAQQMELTSEIISPVNVTSDVQPLAMEEEHK